MWLDIFNPSSILHVKECVYLYMYVSHAETNWTPFTVYHKVEYKKYNPILFVEKSQRVHEEAGRHFTPCGLNTKPRSDM